MIPGTGTGIHWPINNRKQEWDKDLSLRTMHAILWELVKIWAENWE